VAARVHPPAVTIAICTRDRPDLLRRTLEAIYAQSDRGFRVLVVDQGDAPVEPPAPPADITVNVIRDDGRGLSRARNIAWRHATTPWLLFTDDDCLLDSDFISKLSGVIAAYPEAALHSGDVRAGGSGGVSVAANRVATREVHRGDWLSSGRLGFGVCTAVRRTVLAELGGWDERLGAGTPDFPAGEDVEFNFRLLRAGKMAVVSPELRATHDQWRSEAQLTALLEGYMASNAAIGIKHMKRGDLRGGLYLWLQGPLYMARIVSRAIRRRSRLHVAIAAAQARGLFRGTRLAWRQSW
jgi:GT2 family glycosyltransferase